MPRMTLQGYQQHKSSGHKKAEVFFKDKCISDTWIFFIYLFIY